MSDGKHTPGPWHVSDDDRPGMEWNRHIMSGPDHAVCFMAHSDGKAPQRDEANARLVAAAPELLAFAQSMLDAWRGDGLPYPYLIAEAAKKVIAKATGESA